ncbi:MAG: 50S ribosomal protein L3 N(5)-glutamine methyltransferase, partial [Lautropia sp.]|nr:50S ribosomal protein L3 N(5)-glutamine methyltransferase [Lautropia sp.]
MDRADHAPRRVVATGADAVNSVRRVRDLVRHAVSRLDQAGACFGHGTDNAFDEAVWLVCWTLHVPVSHYAELADATVAWPEARAALELTELRCTAGKPLAYLIGEAWLMGYRFRCDERALVPRSLIAEALQQGALAPFMPELQPRARGSSDDARRLRILDLCTGGGSLAIIAAAMFPDALVEGSDLSPDALGLAALNLADYRLEKRVRLVNADLFSGAGRQRFDLILCNPPYVNRESMEHLPAEYRAEPRAALAGGDDGMDLVSRIVGQAAEHLRPSGVLVLEIGNEANHFEQRFPRLEFAYLPVAQG